MTPEELSKVAATIGKQRLSNKIKNASGSPLSIGNLAKYINGSRPIKPWLSDQVMQCIVDQIAELEQLKNDLA